MQWAIQFYQNPTSLTKANPTSYIKHSLYNLLFSIFTFSSKIQNSQQLEILCRSKLSLLFLRLTLRQLTLIITFPHCSVIKQNILLILIWSYMVVGYSYIVLLSLLFYSPLLQSSLLRIDHLNRYVHIILYLKNEK